MLCLEHSMFCIHVFCQLGELFEYAAMCGAALFTSFMTHLDLPSDRVEEYFIL